MMPYLSCKKIENDVYNFPTWQYCKYKDIFDSRIIINSTAKFYISISYQKDLLSIDTRIFTPSNAKAKYETQKERLAGQYKAKTVMFQTTLFLLAWYSLTTTLFQAVQSDMFLVDCKSFFNDLASFIQTFVGWTIDAGHSAAQISTKIPNAFIAGMVYWLLLILIVGICMAGTGMLAILIEIKVIELYKKNCWDVITLLMILTSVAIVIYFGESIKKVLSVNLLLLFVLSQGAYVGIRCYLKVWLEKRPY